MNSQTVIVQEIDGLQVVSGFGRRSIEPMRTRAVVAGLIEATAEHRAVAEKRAEVKEKLAEAGMVFKTAANTRSEQLQRQGMVIYEQGQVLVAELAEPLAALESRRRALMVEHAVYFEPTRYEHLKTDTEISALRSKMAGSNWVGLDGAEIEDNRGRVACVEKSGAWTVRKILTLGEKVPTGGILIEDLDDVQRAGVELQIERDSVARMNAGQKAEARGHAEAATLADSVTMRSGLEIQNDPDSLEKSRVVYDARMAEIAEIYG